MADVRGEWFLFREFELDFVSLITYMIGSGAPNTGHSESFAGGCRRPHTIVFNVRVFESYLRSFRR
jgi:hypothetical protein